jgi:hypothetical protein
MMKTTEKGTLENKNSVREKYAILNAAANFSTTGVFLT